MKTELRGLQITYRGGLDRNTQPVSIEDICKEFYGVKEITFLRNIYTKNDMVYVYTMNQGSVDISKLVEIQKRLKADTFTIGVNNGLFYSFGFIPK